MVLGSQQQGCREEQATESPSTAETEHPRLVSAFMTLSFERIIEPNSDADQASSEQLSITNKHLHIF